MLFHGCECISVVEHSLCFYQLSGSVDHFQTAYSNETWLGRWDSNFIGQWIDAVFMLVSACKNIIAFCLLFTPSCKYVKQYLPSLFKHNTQFFYG